MIRPAGQDPLRLPNYPDPVITSTVPLTIRTTLPITPVEAQPCKALLARQASLPLWMDQTMTDILWSYKYDEVTGVAAESVAAGGSWSVDLQTRPSFCQVTNTNGDISVATGHLQLPPSTNPYSYPICGVSASTIAYGYVPLKGQFQFFVTSRDNDYLSVGDDEVSVDYAIWNDATATDDIIPGDMFNVFAADRCAISPPINTSGWVRPLRVNYTNKSANAGVVGPFDVEMLVIPAATPGFTPLLTYTPGGTTDRYSVTFTVPQVQVALLPVADTPEIDVTLAPWTRTRVTAVAAEFVNVSKALNKSGTVNAGRLTVPGQAWFLHHPSAFRSLHPSQRALLSIQQGFYTYAPPTAGADVFSTPLHTTAYDGRNNMYVFPAVDLLSRGTVNSFSFSDEDGSTKFAIGCDWHLEWTNNSTVFGVAICGGTMEPFHQLIIKLNQHGYFFVDGAERKLLQRPRDRPGRKQSQKTPPKSKGKGKSGSKKPPPRKPQGPKERTTGTTSMPKPTTLRASGVDKKK